MTTEEMQELLDASAVMTTLGLTVTAADAERGRATLRMPINDQVERGAGSGQFHGGAIAAFVDIAGDMAIAARVGGGVPTINLRVDYLRPAHGAHLTAEAAARRIGRTIGVVDVDVRDDEGRLCAVGRGTYSTTVG